MTMSEKYLEDRLMDLTKERERLEKDLNGPLGEDELTKRKNRDARLRVLAKIGSAITRIHNGTYGICIDPDCHQEIPSDRLARTPDADRCIPCQNALEKRGGKIAAH